jgi:hypothetical protein
MSAPSPNVLWKRGSGTSKVAPAVAGGLASYWVLNKNNRSHRPLGRGQGTSFLPSIFIFPLHCAFYGARLDVVWGQLVCDTRFG